MDEDGAELAVGFTVEFGDAFGQLRSMDNILGEVVANAAHQFKRIEQRPRAL